MLDSKYNKAMLKLFLILLGLITITSAFGGAIQIRENFWEELADDEPKNTDINTYEDESNLESTNETSVENKPTTNIPNEPSEKNKISSPIEPNKTIEPFQGSMFSGAVW